MSDKAHPYVKLLVVRVNTGNMSRKCSIHSDNEASMEKNLALYNNCDSFIIFDFIMSLSISFNI